MGGDQNVSADYGRFVALLDSSANLKSLELGIEALELLKRSPFAFDVQLNNQLVEMHANAEMDAGVDGLLFVEEMKKGYGHSPSRRLSLAVFMTCACAGTVLVFHRNLRSLLRGCHLSPRLRVNRHFARIHGDHELENRVEELLVAPDPSEGNDNKGPLPPRKKYNASDMLAEKSRVPKPYEGEGYEMLKGLNPTRKLVMFQICDS
ncbi:hypothetical protein NC653_016771 [Populus alba x Populus x berolinensis]|uniref:Uncharacterized protein n=2 Tax=Populus TaxID=3689 RepID=A0A4U5QRD1_POPAL|nr:hypothetical protein NC653_016771 [Populus alba x Populus x berolinensis]TKS13502.1 hypothetical protein D5086_0000052550 [Populus alba]